MPKPIYHYNRGRPLRAMSVNEDEKATADFHAREARNVSEAVASVQRLESFHDRPAIESGETVIGWLWRIAREPLSPHVAETQLRADPYRVSRRLRSRVFSLPDLDPARAAVVLHVALVIGSDAILSDAPLWAALRDRDYSGAGDCLLMTRWPAMAGDDETERRRVLALARQMREGRAP